MNKWVKRKWVRALRSGEYEKGKGTLIQTTRWEYCCLGVLACEMVPEFVQIDEWVGRASIKRHGDEGYLPDDLSLLWGLDKNAQLELSRINDNSSTFGQVIAYIEENL